jgi:hypothetical protein
MSSPPGLSVSGTCVASDSLAGSPKVDGTYRNVRYLPRTFLSKNYTETNGTQAGSMELVFAVFGRGTHPARGFRLRACPSWVRSN